MQTWMKAWMKNKWFKMACQSIGHVSLLLSKEFHWREGQRNLSREMSPLPISLRECKRTLSSGHICDFPRLCAKRNPQNKNCVQSYTMSESQRLMKMSCDGWIWPTRIIQCDVSTRGGSHTPQRGDWRKPLAQWLHHRHQIHLKRLSEGGRIPLILFLICGPLASLSFLLYQFNCFL